MVSLRAYSRHRGVSLAAVQAAIDSGRLVKSLTADNKGRRKLVSVELADQEWSANTRPSSSRVAATTAPVVSHLPDVAPAQHAARSMEPPTEEQRPDAGIDYAEARRRREVELWRQARVKREADELELAVRRGEVVAVDQARADVFECYTVVKTRLLGVATRTRQRLPHLTAEDVRTIDDMVREALEELADDDGGEDENDADEG